MVNPGSFGLSRKAFLISQKPAYSAGVVDGYAADALAVIQRKYHKCFPIDLPHDKEPYPEQFAPDIETLGEEEYARVIEALEKRQKQVAFCQAVSDHVDVCLSGA